MQHNQSHFMQRLKQSFIPDISELPTRRHDLDWLRVLAFGLLILFHSGMFYVENWGFHAKSQYRSQSLESIMLLIEPWRMAILWIIAGIAIKFIMAKISLVRFVYQRSLRLLIPLLFGILIVVPPQLYVEMTQNNDLSISFWQFMAQFYSPNSDIFDKYSSGIWPHIDVNHLWFLRSLWKYSLVIMLLTPILNSHWITQIFNGLMNRHFGLIIALFTAPLFAIQMLVPEEQTRYFVGFTCMVYGYLIGWNPTFWQRITIRRHYLLIAVMISAVILLIFYNLVWMNPEEKPQWLSTIGLINYNLMRILGIFTAFGFAHYYLNKSSKTLAYFNDAVYPFYVIHQTLIIVIGYQLTALSLGPVAEPILLILATIVSCFVFFEIIRRIDLLRFCFGLTMKKSYSKPLTALGKFISFIAMLIIGLEIIF